jgi:hypothetical protein
MFLILYVLIEYGYALKSKGNKKIISVMNTAFGKPSSESMPFNLKHLRFPVTYELSNDSRAELKNGVREGLKQALTSEIKLVLEMEGKSSDSLSVEVLTDRVLFYVRSNLKKALLIPRLKISNISERPVNVDVEKIEVDIEGDWHEAIRSTFAGGRIDTNKGGVIIRNLDNFVPKDQTLRLGEFDSKPAFFAYDLDIRDFKNLVVNSETLSIRGQARSVDGRTANFSGKVTRYG